MRASRTLTTNCRNAAPEDEKKLMTRERRKSAMKSFYKMRKRGRFARVRKLRMPRA
jgi:hypothetical protein